MTAALTATPIAEPLDAYLREVVQTLHSAVNLGMRRAAENPAAAGGQIRDCQEILAEIMRGDVKEWLA